MDTQKVHVVLNCILQSSPKTRYTRSRWEPECYLKVKPVQILSTSKDECFITDSKDFTVNIPENLVQTVLHFARPKTHLLICGTVENRAKRIINARTMYVS